MPVWTNLKITNAHEKDGWYVIVRKMKAKQAYREARKRQVESRVVSKAVCVRGVWFCITKIKKED
jgi:hypothetical protein